MTDSQDLAAAGGTVILPRKLRPFHYAFVFIFLIAAALRLYHIDAQSLWTDEFYSIQSANGWWIGQLPLDQVIEPAPHRMSVAGARPLREVCSALTQHDNH